MQNITVQAYYKENVLGALENYAAKQVHLTEKHQGQMEADLKEIERRRQEKYLDKLATKDKSGKATLGRVVHNDVRFSFISLIIEIGAEVQLGY